MGGPVFIDFQQQLSSCAKAGGQQHISNFALISGSSDRT
jgi:hypothetical protein